MMCVLEQTFFLAFCEQAPSCVEREIHHRLRNICRTKPFRPCNRLLTYKPMGKYNQAAGVKKSIHEKGACWRNDDGNKDVTLKCNLALLVKEKRNVSRCSKSKNTKFKKLRRLLQRKRYTKIEHVVQNRRSALSLAWREWFSCKRQRMKDLLLRARVVVRTLKMKISFHRLADYVKKLQQMRAARAARLFFLIQPIKLLICGVVGFMVRTERKSCSPKSLTSSSSTRDRNKDGGIWFMLQTKRSACR